MSPLTVIRSATPRESASVKWEKRTGSGGARPDPKLLALAERVLKAMGESEDEEMSRGPNCLPPEILLYIFSFLDIEKFELR